MGGIDPVDYRVLIAHLCQDYSVVIDMEHRWIMRKRWGEGEWPQLGRLGGHFLLNRLQIGSQIQVCLCVVRGKLVGPEHLCLPHLNSREILSSVFFSQKIE